MKTMTTIKARGYTVAEARAIEDGLAGALLEMQPMSQSKLNGLKLTMAEADQVLTVTRSAKGVHLLITPMQTPKTCDNCRKRHACSQEGEDCTGWGR